MAKSHGAFGCVYAVNVMCCWCAKNATTRNRQWNAKSMKIHGVWNAFAILTERYDPNVCILHTTERREKKKWLRRAIKAIRIVWEASVCANAVVKNSKQNRKWNGCWLDGAANIHRLRSLRATRSYIWIFWWDMNFLLAFPESFVAIWKRERMRDGERERENEEAIFHAAHECGHVKCADFAWCTRNIFKIQIRHFSRANLSRSLPLWLWIIFSLKIIVLKHSASGVTLARFHSLSPLEFLLCVVFWK